MKSAAPMPMIAPTGTETIRLEYAARPALRFRPTLLYARRVCLLIGAMSVLLGLAVRENIGSGRFIPNPIRVLMVGTLYLSVAVYVTLRIVDERRSPVWIRMASTGCAWGCIGLLPVAYYGWNRWRGYPGRFVLRDESVTTPLIWILSIVALFAALRVYLWWFRRRDVQAAAELQTKES